VGRSIEQINTKAAKCSIAGWFLGLAYFNWFSSTAAHVSIAGHIVLVVVGLFAVSILIGMIVALILGLIAKFLTGRIAGISHGDAWGALISPAIAFFAADWAIRLVAEYV
jgi:hypothetical protein